ncbi:hypothetical protein BEH62_06000 [Clavibacter michiganensis subsp. insidiosus]|nr:hypothetical protein BEH61_08985 [Clavibacter michiganensis subsp. insidiosus]AWG01147.1 hypothetical protein BEH62_06000 [Clavibacter michiganensis subsp. insidiosus]
MVAENTMMTYSQLWARATAQAEHLRRVGVRPGDYVGLYLEPGERLLVAVWAVLLADAAYVPLAVDYPSERIRYMIAQSAVAHIITDDVSASPARKLTPDGVHVHIAGEGTPTLAGAYDPDMSGSAYVIFTSGSTGKPKGVVIPHSAITHQMRWLAQEMALGQARILLKTPTSFDAAQWELLANAVGGTVIVGEAGIHRDPSRIRALVDSQHATHLQCVPTLWRALCREPEFARCESLTHVFSGGEALTPGDAKDIMQTLPHARLFNLYGPTETTINATSHRVGVDDVDPPDPVVTIGRPIPGCSVHILDAKRQPVALGDHGELAIGGPQVASGYLNDAARTEERFVTIEREGVATRVYLTGDIVSRDSAGALHFHGRTDDQVKVNGHRVETEEVRLAVEQHHWVRSAAVVPWKDPRDGVARLAAFVELDPHEAALMDADRAGQHHRSKKGHEQVLAQLAVLSRDGDRPDDVVLANAEGTPEQRRFAFGRKTYRFYEGGQLTVEDITRAVDTSQKPVPVAPLAALDVHVLAELLRWFGPFTSPERLLPKYAYASPGALNATTIYLEACGIEGLLDGMYEYRHASHGLRRVGPVESELPGPLRFHFVGSRRAIDSVYATNIDEVLHFEGGHMAGLLDHAAAQIGYSAQLQPSTQDARIVAAEHVCTAVIDLGPAAPAGDDLPVRVTVQMHDSVKDARSGTYDVGPAGLRRLSADIIERRHVIAINQETYDRSSFGVGLSVPSTAGWRGFVALGRALQRLQMNSEGIGLMSAGYSSLTGRDLPSALQYANIVGDASIMYFAVAGPVSEEQIRSTGMHEDSVHTRGPEEILRDDLRRTLPYYMVPSRITIVDEIPVSSSGKHDRAALVSVVEASVAPHAVVTPPKTDLERSLLDLWNETLRSDHRSVTADFFDLGGNSLDAVQLINRINRVLGVLLPVQTVFERPTVRGLAEVLSSRSLAMSRLIKLADGPGPVCVVWPGLGGYPMNLRAFAEHLSSKFTVYAVQTHGLNVGEVPYTTLREMIDRDIMLIDGALGDQDLAIAGYSFGARVATEVAATLTARGRAIKQVILLAPGSPFVPGLPLSSGDGFGDSYFRHMAYSVFVGRLPDDEAAAQLASMTDQESFLEALTLWRPGFDLELAARILAVASTTFGFRGDTVTDVDGLLAKMHVFAALGDTPSFLRSNEVPLEEHGQLRRLSVDHYAILRDPAVETVVGMLEARQVRVG